MGRWERSGYRKGWHERIACMVPEEVRPPRPLTKYKLVLTRHASALCDPDNLAASFKEIVDGLVYCGVLADDKIENFFRDCPHCGGILDGQPEWRFEKVKRKDEGVTIEIIGKDW